VAEGRKLKREFVEEIAQGRVWSGSEALKLGLVDELGGLDAAIKFAAAEAKLGSGYRLSEYPRKKELVEAVQEILGKVVPENVRSRSVAAQLAARVEADLKTLQSFNDPGRLRPDAT
jgi:protease-4